MLEVLANEPSVGRQQQSGAEKAVEPVEYASVQGARDPRQRRSRSRQTLFRAEAQYDGGCRSFLRGFRGKPAGQAGQAADRNRIDEQEVVGPDLAVKRGGEVLTIQS